ncbi:hypothetical protein GCM10022247_26270 [Allokutzneria multivorans]|uniref:Streptomyces killer toxin-like beta/gamma crystallin domain-containing protein n=1 Tax=Allokutzneria multivorans TaxID=1142134 RepID=A0ABP7RYG2_9PSEU
MRTLSAALALCAATVGQTGVAQAAPASERAAGTAANSIQSVRCGDPAFLTIMRYDGPLHCFAYAGTMSVALYDVFAIDTGNNSVRITYKTIQGRVLEARFGKWTRNDLDSLVAVTEIQIY